MKLKSIASLCKERKTVYIHSGSDCQYIGNGSAFYLVPGKLKLDRENVLVVFDIPRDKQDDWLVNDLGIPPEIKFAEELGEPADVYQMELRWEDDTYRIMKDANGFALVNTKYLAPLAGMEAELSYNIRKTNSGQVYIAVKTGWYLQAVIVSSNNMISQCFMENLSDIYIECEMWQDKHSEEELEEEIQLRIDDEGGNRDDSGIGNL